MQVDVILNPGAGSLAANGDGSSLAIETLRTAFARVGVSARVFHEPPAGLTARIRGLLERKPPPGDAVVVGGGDGTLGCASGLLAGTALPLGVLPMGTLNHFARDLGLPADLDGCIQIIAAGQVRPVDVAEVNGRVFINNCSIGAYPAAVRRRNELRRRHGIGKWPAMLLATWHVLRELRRLRVELTLDGESHVRRSPFVLVSNNRYTGQVLSRQLRPRLDEGLLCTHTTRAHRFAPLLRLVWSTFTAGIEAADGLEIRVGRELTVKLGERTPTIAADGEIFLTRSPLVFRALPAALRVLAPARDTP